MTRLFTVVFHGKENIGFFIFKYFPVFFLRLIFMPFVVSMIRYPFVMLRTFFNRPSE